MKKFIKSTIVMILILGSLGTYYVQSAMVTNDLPRYHIEKVKGEEELIDNLIIRGTYSHEEVNDRFVLTNQGIEYSSELNIVERFEGQYNFTRQRLREKYPDFMRGTQYVHNNLYEDDQYLILVKEDYEYEQSEAQHELEISMLNKESKEEKEFEVTVKEMSHIVDIQYVDSNVHIYIKKRNHQSQNISIVDLTINPNSGSIENETVLIESKQSNKKNQYVNISQLGESVNYAPMQYLLFRDQLETVEEGTDGMRVTDRESELLAYNTETGEDKKLDLSQKEYGLAAMFDGKYLYFEVYTEQGDLVMKPYNVESESFEDSITIEVGKQRTNILKTVKDGQLYIVHNSKVKVFDVQSGDVVYEGKIVSGDNPDLEFVYFDFVEFK
ncbi:hypothetical protein E3U55_01530 [Filobacillus milosensis]|uniref:Uncharacterized protein n=1 Tax=Filobacillus milosensis TaxID=94137 RepID=A0A4Y8IZM4_9BACI|nr:hypothetical protein [Filobacillus milosensis]TFB25101.1 hypothetical protein E3U55_01530 [Filobacillus milosensis]